MPGAEPQDIGHVLDNLRVRFPDVAPDLLRTEVDRAEAGFADATVRDFLPVLIEREVRIRLRATGPA